MDNIFCIECGFELRVTAKFCRVCGAKLSVSKTNKSELEVNEAFEENEEEIDEIEIRPSYLKKRDRVS